MRWDEDLISPHFIDETFCVLGFENDGRVKSEGGPAPADCGQDHTSGSTRLISDHTSGSTQCLVNTSADQ